ncbi:hypothetical protein [Halopseudomonas pelagia]|uniref:hypothetical protein n=1 Tax=Halopseudomonas pelagia TaxID=553151 RepID=UPI0030D710C6|tara:strand:- start:3134 stop:3544 length:411 start_codon:yes stop_codon:yes gene_type:complete
MQIECPACKKGNSLNLEQAVRCGHCKAELTGSTYKKTKKVTGAVVLALFAGAVGHNVLSSDDRYSIAVEYELVHTCVSGSQRAQAIPAYEIKKEDCICALRAVQPDFSVVKMRKDTQQFVDAFWSEATACRASRAG